MRKLIPLATIILLVLPGMLYAAGYPPKNNRDSLKLKCILYSANLFFGCELGEKPLNEEVDTLVTEINNYDSSSQLNLVLVSAKDLGFRGWRNIFWNAIIDSALNHGFRLCPPQAGPEILVMTQGGQQTSGFMAANQPDGKPIYIGMDKLRHNKEHEKKGRYLLSGANNYFDYVFCIRQEGKNDAYQLGYCITDNATHLFTWTEDDLFLFVRPDKPISAQSCSR